jgi:hypothetical protein
MNIEMLVDGQPLVKVDLDVALLARILRAVAEDSGDADAKSTPATEAQMKELLSRIDQRSVQFLTALAASEDGSITWIKMREIFGIKDEDDWAAYSGSFGKGITRAYRKILGDKTARLVWWIDADWDEHDWDSEMCSVYVDGPALGALRAATRK